MANDKDFVNIKICYLDESKEKSSTVYEQTFHRLYLESLPHDWLQFIIATLNKLEIKNG